MWEEKVPLFSDIFEKQFNKLTGLKFETQYFLSVLLSTGKRVATFAPDAVVFDAKQLLITSERDLAEMFANNLFYRHLVILGKQEP